MSTNVFVKNINDWIVLDDTIKKINSNLKEIRYKKNVLEKEIITFASSNNLNNKVLNINETKLGFNVSTTYPSISIKLLKEVLEETIEEPEGIDIIINKISKKREELSKNNIHIKRK
jgi:hypothetical protein